MPSPVSLRHQQITTLSAATGAANVSPAGFRSNAFVYYFVKNLYWLRGKYDLNENPFLQILKNLKVMCTQEFANQVSNQ